MLTLRTITLSLTALFALAGLTYAEPAAAQATRTWVSGVGDDANPCSRTAPCKTFAGAISKTAANGEINCLDPGGFGGVTITKSISIVCDYTEGGVLTAGAGVNGIVINIPATSTVFLSGLDFHGAGSAQNGIRIVSGGTVHVRNSVIRNYQATNGQGMSIQPSGALNLTVTNTAIINNGTATTGGGILIQPTGVAGTARVTLRGVTVQNNAFFGLRFDSTGNTGPASTVVIDDSQFVGSTNGVNFVVPAGTTSLEGMVTNTLVAHNSNVGLRTSGTTARLRVGNTTVTANGDGVVRAGGSTMNSYGTNRVDGNTVDGTFTSGVIPEK